MMGRWRRGVVSAMAVAILASFAAAPGAAADEEEKARQAARRKEMLEAGRSALCRAHFYFKRPADERTTRPQDWRGREDWARSMYAAFASRQMSMVAVGVLLDDEGHILIDDTDIENKYIDRIEVVAPDGTRYPAVRDTLLDRVPAEVLKVTEPLRNWKAPEFVEDAEITSTDSAFLVGLAEVGKEWLISGVPLGGLYDYAAGEGPPQMLMAAGRQAGGSALFHCRVSATTMPA